MPHRRRAAVAALALAIALSACAHKKKARITPPQGPIGIGYSETGVASWYGHPYHGRQAADGEIYDMEKLTAAHRTLPFDTWVAVRNLKNDREVEVRIIDRGPFVDGRVIDLSHAAAAAIDMIGPGTAPVRITVIRTPKEAPPGLFAVQVGSFRVRENADRTRTDMAARYGSARIVPRPGGRDTWRVLVGQERTQEAAQELARRIREDSHEKSTGLIVRIDSVQ